MLGADVGDLGNDVDALPLAAAFQPLPRARVIDEDPAHRARREPEELAASGRADAAVVDQPDPRLVDERRRLQRVAVPLVAEQPAGHVLELAVQGLEQPLFGTRLSVLRGCEQASRPLLGVVHVGPSIGRSIPKDRGPAPAGNRAPAES